MIDDEKVAILPLCRYGCNRLNLRDLEAVKEAKGLTRLNRGRLNIVQVRQPD